MVRKGWIWGICIVLLLAGCVTPTPVAPTATSAPPETEAPPATPVPTAMPAAIPGRIVISEFLPGVLGENNNYEFIELYNAGTEAVDLRGWSLVYRLAEGQAEERVYRWSAQTEVPGFGHYLLVREGQDVGVVPDAVFTVPLYERKGGLVLRAPDQAVVDALGWGDAPGDYADGQPAAAPTGGSLERLPGGAQGNGEDSDDNSADFVLNTAPAPQNSGSPITPLPEQRLVITALAPESITPGTEFEMQIEVENRTGTDIGTAMLLFPLPEGFAFIAGPSGVTYEDGLATWSLSEGLADGALTSWMLRLRSPWSYVHAYVGGYYVASEDWMMRAYGAPVPIVVEGGAIPIEVARTLEGDIVTVEGVATMYTGGFYAGSTGTKFYLEDGTGGIQAYCPGGQGEVSVKIGDRVRVTGQIELYRGAMEIVPSTYPDDVVVLETGGAPPPPQPLTVREATSDERVLGRLNTVAGRITRFEEFSYSYELDLIDDQGDTVLVYIDKDSRLNPEFLDVGDRYQVTGISEIYDTTWQLKPRLEADFERIYPPELMLDMLAQNSVASGGLITYTLTATNHTDAPLTNVQILAVPSPYVEVVDIPEDIPWELAGEITWTVPELPPGGGAVSVHYTVRVDPEVPGDRLEAIASASAEEWPELVEIQPWTTFIGSGVPIWAIQGEGATSPFVRSVATTEGVVTGVFPEQEGFWIQSLTPDDNAATSEGLFVLTPADELPISLGDTVRVTGKIRERSGQTLLHLGTLDDLSVESSGNPLPDAVEMDPPQEGAASRAYFEAVEGMLVSVTEPAVAVGPTSQYGEYAVVRSRWGISRVLKGEPKGMLIFVDDGSAVTHLDQSTLPYAVKTGDRVGDLLGPLAYTYENYKIQPIITPTLVTQALPLPTLAPADPDALSIATFNIENFFDVLDPHPSSPPRPSIGAYKLKVAKAVDAILAMGAPTIIGFQEVENIGILEDIVEEPTLAPYAYVPALIEGFDSRGIDVGYLVRGDHATIEGLSQHPAPEGLTSRPPLLITVTVRLGGGEQMVQILNNHFTSMSGGELATEARRNAQAAWNRDLVAQILEADADAHVVVLGDLNSFYRSPPMDTLRAGGLRHAYERVAPDLPYTYIYQGESETLDHILMTPGLYEYLVRVEALHINADYPLAAPDDPSARRVSDHDPLVVVFEFD